jgi:hydrogenase maturation factor
MTKSAAVGAVGIFSRLFRSRIETELGPQVAQKGWDTFEMMSTVDDALAAASYGVRGAGVAAMHDATECGVVGAAVEMAEASGVGLELHRDNIVVYPEIRAICELFGMNPEISISEGTLILAVKENHFEAFTEHMTRHGTPVTEIGRFLPASNGAISIRDGRRESLQHPSVDPFWAAFDRAMQS